MLGKYVRNLEIGIFGIGIKAEFTDDPSKLRDLRLDFLITLRELFYALKEEKAGIVLILDDLNGVTRIPEFAHFLKSTVDEIASGKAGILPLLLILVGVSDRMKEMISIQPSVGRIFDMIELSLMDGSEAQEFFTKAFESVHMTVNDSAMQLLIKYSGGHPALLHEVGDAVYWTDTDNIVTDDDANLGILLASDNVGRKYLDRQVYETIRSKTYRTILRKLPIFGMTIKRKEILEKMTDEEQKRFDQFRVKMVSLGLLRKGEARGEYIFANELFRIYVMIEALRATGLLSRR